MPTEVRTPFTRAAARQVYPDTWRKKVLPVGEVAYKGRMLKFTPGYLHGLAEAFQDGAYDQVPFQIADAQNGHTNDPERFGGEIVGVDVQPDGLYVTARTTARGSQLLANNPRLGVSARIVEGYDRSDGKHYPQAMQHVLGTLDPRIPGLGAWQAVEMSNAPDYIVDLSTADFAGEEEGGIMPDLTADQQDRLARLLELDPEKLNALIAGVDNSTVDYETDDLSDDDLAAMIDEMDDEAFASMLAEYEADTLVPSLSNGGYDDSFELANYRVAETERQLAVVNAELDRQRFENEKRKLMGLGVPSYIAEMARPLLEGAGHVVEMSNGTGDVDAGRVMRDVLVEFGKAASMLDFGSEMGTVFDEPDTSQTAEQNRRSFVTDFRQFTGI